MDCRVLKHDATFRSGGEDAISNQVLPVFSTDGFAAKRSRFSPLALNTGLSFSALGENIESSLPGHLDNSHKRVQSGTSFATPLADPAGEEKTGGPGEEGMAEEMRQKGQGILLKFLFFGDILSVIC